MPASAGGVRRTGDDVDRAHQTIVERRLALFDEPRDLAVAGHAAQRRQAPRQRAGGEQRGQPPASAVSATGAPSGQRAATSATPTTTAAISAPRDRRPQRHERPPARADAGDQLADLHGTEF